VNVTIDGGDELAADLDRAADQIADEAEKVVKKGDLNIKRSWAAAWQGLAHAPALPSALSYDTRRAGTVITSEIGPDKDRPQGALGNLLEFGSVNNAPHPGGVPALDAEEPRFVAALAAAAVKVLEGR
jgi:hypothetical protein